MKVLMLSTDTKIFEPDSAVSARLSKYGALGESVTFLVFGPGAGKDIPLSANVRAVTAGGRGKVSALFLGALELLKLSREAGVISSQDPFFVGLVGLKISWLRKIPYQVQLHTDCFSDAYANESLRRRIEVLVAAFVVKNASCVRAVSERIARSARRITAKPVSVLPIFVPMPAPFSRTVPDGFSVLAVSRLTAEKRVDLIIRAVAEMKDAQLTILGDGPLKAELEALAKNLNIAERVHFAGWQKPDEYLSKAGAYVQASLYEGYGMALMEAALRGVPIVATDAGLAGDVFRNGQEMLVAAPTSRGIADELARIKLEPQLAARLAESARKKAEGLIVSEDEYLARYAAALKTCL